ncbi:MAG: hypothetical protein FWH11_01175 [Micrococcales bacterium]|nr:hypothetical protein [Micrococcales bacterium]
MTATPEHLRGKTDRRRRGERRDREWVGVGDLLVAQVASGAPLGLVLRRLGLTAAAVTARRRRDPGFAQRLDDALMASRDPDLAHGTHGGWRAGCRCPECREHHAAHRD